MMIQRFVAASQHPFVRDVRASLKSLEVEEGLDLVLHRPLGLLFSRWAVRRSLSPMAISWLSLAAGFLAGICLYRQGDPGWVAAGAVLLTLSAVFDSADGQVARMTGTSSRAGMILDGIIDTAVFVFVHFFAALYFAPRYGPWIFLFALVSGMAMSFRAQVYDFYKNELQYLSEMQEAYRNPTTAEADVEASRAGGFWDRVRYGLYRGYVRRQGWFVSRRNGMRRRFEDLRDDPSLGPAFRRRYKETYAPLLTLWALAGGSNAHRILILVFSLFGRFDLYLAWSLAVLSALFAALLALQRQADTRFLREFPLPAGGAR